MALETFLTLIAFAFVAAGTPGPNTMMLFSSGVNFGFRNTVPHMFGIGIGFLLLVLGIGFGLGALLTAFPTLGLAKIVWAVDIILSMEINDFAVEALNGAEAWHDLGAAVDFPDGEARRITAGYRAVFVWRRGDALRVYDSTCPHQVTNIPELAICDNHLTCPKHNWKFDLETGDCIEKGDQPLKTFEARIENGVVQAWW